MCQEVCKGLIQSKSLFSYPDHEPTCFQGFFWESRFFPFSSSVVLQLSLSLFCERMGTTLTGTHYWQLLKPWLHILATTWNFHVLPWILRCWMSWNTLLLLFIGCFPVFFCGQECHKHRFFQFSLFLILFPTPRNIDAFNFRWALKVTRKKPDSFLLIFLAPISIP